MVWLHLDSQKFYCGGHNLMLRLSCLGPGLGILVVNVCLTDV